MCSCLFCQFYYFASLAVSLSNFSQFLILCGDFFGTLCLIFNLVYILRCILSFYADFQLKMYTLPSLLSTAIFSKLTAEKLRL